LPDDTVVKQSDIVDDGQRPYDTPPNIPLEIQAPPDPRPVSAAAPGESSTHFADARLREELVQLGQNTTWRESLFKRMSALVLVVEIVSVALLVVYVVSVLWRSQELNVTVVTSWIVANVAQVIGILAVITRHLFPDHIGGTRRS
jgi:hypothetical protein